MDSRYASFLPPEAVAARKRCVLISIRRVTAFGSFRFASSQLQAREIKLTVRWVAPVRALRHDHGCNGSQSIYNVQCVVQPPHMRVARRQLYMRKAS